jgi:hypothetical protein
MPGGPTQPERIQGRTFGDNAAAAELTKPAGDDVANVFAQAQLEGTLTDSQLDSFM